MSGDNHNIEWYRALFPLWTHPSETVLFHPKKGTPKRRPSKRHLVGCRITKTNEDNNISWIKETGFCGSEDKHPAQGCQSAEICIPFRQQRTHLCGSVSKSALFSSMRGSSLKIATFQYKHTSHRQRAISLGFGLGWVELFGVGLQLV